MPQRKLTIEQLRLLTYDGPRSVSISGDGWDDLVRAGLIVDDTTAIRLTPEGRVRRDQALAELARLDQADRL